MNSKFNKEKLFKKLNAQNIFWSYNVNSVEDISDALLIEHCLIYSDIPEIKMLFQIFPFKFIKEVWVKRVVPDKRYDKLNYYLGKIFFGIDEINLFLEQKLAAESRFERLKQLS
ncbi:hypothetical protein KAH37_07145 [bacterium]|nr:hypothetical protein [bacterium]